MESEKPLIAECATKCLAAFNQDARLPASIYPQEYSWIENQSGRIAVWTSNIGVFAPGRASLDHRLREVPEVRNAILGLLEVLSGDAQDCECSPKSYKKHDYCIL